MRRNEGMQDRRVARYRLVRSAKAAAGGAGRGVPFIVIGISEHADYLRCRRWNPKTATAGEDVIAVARPWLLQQSRFDGFILDGFSYSYDGPNFRIKTRESDGKSEQQVIVPAYANETGSDVHQIILAIPTDTGLVEEDDVGPIDDAFITWMDLNVDGRAWAKKA